MVMSESRLPHGYTNTTGLDGDVVEKQFVGPDGGDRMSREVLALNGLASRLPLPSVLNADHASRTLRLSFMPGRHGQEILDDAPAATLSALGSMAQRVHDQPRSEDLVDLPGTGSSLVHGDFGPQNCLLNEDGTEVLAILDWDFGVPSGPHPVSWEVRTRHRCSQCLE